VNVLRDGLHIMKEMVALLSLSVMEVVRLTGYRRDSDGQFRVLESRLNGPTLSLNLVVDGFDVNAGATLNMLEIANRSIGIVVGVVIRARIQDVATARVRRHPNSASPDRSNLSCDGGALRPASVQAQKPASFSAATRALLRSCSRPAKGNAFG
jgi:hypothetical protein